MVYDNSINKYKTVFQKNIYSIYVPNNITKYIKEYVIAIGKKNNCREAQLLFNKYLGLDSPCSKITSNSSIVFYLDNIGYTFDFKSLEGTLNGCCFIRTCPNTNNNEFIFGNVFQEQYSIIFDYDKELITFYIFLL